MRHEIIDLLRFLLNRIRSLSSPISFARDIPIRTHATYSLQEISAAYNILDQNGRLLIPREGVFWHKKTKTDLLFVTLDKSERDYSDTTNYNDYAISPTLFHWESQNNTSPTTPTGQRYIQQGESDTNVILFVREGKKDQRGETTPYLCLGPADYVNHKSERPMEIMWKLKNPMPNWLWQRARSIAG